MPNSRCWPKAKKADVALLVEGAYPMVTGGVSAWVHQIIKFFPELSFAVLFLGSKSDDYQEIKYELPKNVVHFEAHYLFDMPAMGRAKPVAGRPQAFEQVKSLHDCMKKADSRECMREVMSDLTFFIDPKKNVDEKQFLYSREAWDMIVDMYQRYCTEPSFLDYFWTVRSVHQPLWRLVPIVNHFPNVKMVHTVSTGYAGLLAALLHQVHQLPIVLTEHGIYTKERRIELMSSTMVKSPDPLLESPIEPSYLRNIWIQFFEALAKMCYGATDTILSLYHGARDRQIQDGACVEKTAVIPNGVNVVGLAGCRHTVDFSRPLVIALVGRVVPIKDIKTFIRAAKSLQAKQVHFVAWIIGPQDEDPDYVSECQQLIDALDLHELVVLKGLMRLTEILKKIDLMVLSSISEGMPLTVLEAFAAGLPAVVTDVGACREVVVGDLSSANDVSTPPAGIVVPISDPHALAEAVMCLLKNPQTYRQYSEAAIFRAEKYFDERLVRKQYQSVYQKAMQYWPA